jgi:hypothetical protein
MPLPMWDPALAAEQQADGMPPAALAAEPVDGLADLGRKIAADPRFATCTARRFAGFLTETPPLEIDADRASALAERLVEADWDARMLVLDIVTDPAPLPPQHVRPEQLSRMIEDLTGLVWDDTPESYGQADRLTTDEHGYRMLLGGINGWDAVVPVHASTATRELVLARLAELAAAHAVREGVWPPGGVTVEPDRVDAVLAQLSLRVLGVPAAPGSDDPGDPVAGLRAVFDGALARSGNAEHAWKVTLTALLLDPRAVMY